MEQNNNNSNTIPEVLPSIADLDATTKEVSAEDLTKLIAALKSTQPTNYKKRMQGIAGSAKPKVSKHWYNGNLISKADFDKLSWEEIHASNNIIRK